MSHRTKQNITILLVFLVGFIILTFISLNVGAFILGIVIYYLIYIVNNYSTYASMIKSPKPRNNNYDDLTTNLYLDNDDLMYISAKEKAKYLLSPEWAELKGLRLIIDGNQCQSCGSENNLDCHHVSYRRLTQEHLDDVVILCRTCHNNLHKRLGYDRTTRYNID